MGNGQISLAHNSCTQRANALKLEISSTYLIQYILSENQGSATMLINKYTGSDISGKWSIAAIDVLPRNVSLVTADKTTSFRPVWFVLHTASGCALSLMQYKPYSRPGCGLTIRTVYMKTRPV